jgi:hypothetical protein
MLAVLFSLVCVNLLVVHSIPTSLGDRMPGRHRLVPFIALIVVALHAVGCSSTSSLGITGAVVPNATVGAVYTSSQFNAKGGSGTYMWSATGLPPGITISGASTATLTVAGTPTTAGTYTVSITVTDSAGRAVTSTGSIAVSASSSTLTINGTLPLTGSVGAAYSGTLTATGGSGSYTWNLDGLPAGLAATNTTSATVTVSGTPTSAKTYQVTITLTDSASNIANNSETISISSSSGLSATGALAGTATVGTAYSGSLTATGGSTPYAWTVNGLPDGVTATNLSSATVSIAGTPTTAGTYDVSALVTDSKSATYLYTVTIIVSAGAALTSGACIGTTTAARGNEAGFTAPYAFVLQGADSSDEPVAWAGSFTPNGSGGISAADVDAVSISAGPASYQLNLAESSYSFGADGRGCLYLAFSGINVPASAPGKPDSGTGMSNAFPSNVPGVLFSFTVSTTYQTGRVVQSDYVTSGVATAGQMHQQTASDFALSKFGANYAFGLAGWFVNGSDSLERAAIAGSATLNTNSFSFTNINADENIGGTPTGSLTGGSGTFGQSISAATGRTCGFYTITTPSGTTSFNFAAYIVNSSDFFIITTDHPSTNAYLLTGRGLMSAGTSAPTGGHFMLVLSGIDFSGGAPGQNFIQLGLLTINGDTGPGMIFTAGKGAGASRSFNGKVATNAATGRTLFANDEGSSPAIYWTAAHDDSIVAFLVGTDPDTSSGFLAFQTSGAPAYTSIAGTFALGSAEDISGTRGNVIGATTFSAVDSVSVTSDFNSIGERAAPVEQTATGNYAVSENGGGSTNSTASGSFLNQFFITNGALTFSTDSTSNQPLLYISIAQVAAQ